ncbi:MAG: 50S ribosome-binding GTPase [Promicromonosporaceae bacterium]|nr:50S ribosome-binding GTPase [Promicromonosporaceae bacterium]
MTEPLLPGDLAALRGHGRADTFLSARADALAAATELAGPRLGADLAERLTRAVAGVRQRLSLGVEHTVVALAGGTGSGKSSLFNALSRLDFADVGVKRPTTSRITAVAWDREATALLDWLGADAERRICVGDALSAEPQLSGLVLLDLPDHDSVEASHRLVVDRVTPLVDLLIWVVDPQKYADHALHAGYLAASAGLEGAMLVLVNQIDTVAADSRAPLLADLSALLAGHGLPNVPVLAASAVTGEGLSAVRPALAEAGRRQSVAAGRAAAELEGAARLLVAQAPAPAPWRRDDAVARELPALIHATGLQAVAGQVEAAIINGYGRPEFPPTDRDEVTLLRARLLQQAGTSLPPLWQRDLAERVESADGLRSAAVSAVRALDLRAPRPRVGRRKRVAALAAAHLFEAGSAALRQVLDDALGRPASQVFGEYQQVRELGSAALKS